MANKSVNKKVFDNIIHIESLLQRYSAKQAEKIINEVINIDEFTAQLYKNLPRKYENKYLKLKKMLVEHLNKMSKNALDKTYDGAIDLSDKVVVKISEVIEESTPFVFNPSVPDPKQILVVAEKSPMTEDGWLVKESFNRWGEVNGQIIAGYIHNAYISGVPKGEIIDSLVSNVRPNEPAGELKKITDSLNRLVRTTLQHYAATARDMMYKENGAIIKSYQWVATLDTRTCTVCGQLDGKVFDLEKGPKPPVHWNCRCTTIPVLKSWKELGSDIEELDAMGRASMDGEVPASMTWPEWIKQKEEEEPGFAKEVLGKGMYDLWKDGKIKLDEYSPTDNAFTLDELKSRLKRIKTIEK